LQVGDADYNQTRCTLVKYNFVVRDKELAVQREEQASKHANAETEFQRQVDPKKPNIELKQAEENVFKPKLAGSAQSAAELLK